MTAPTLLDAGRIREATPWVVLIDAIRSMLTDDAVRSPEREVHTLEPPDGSAASLLVMPSWIGGDVIGVKAVTHFPANDGPSINAGYLLFDGSDGRLLAVLDGDELTARRTAAVSALASSHLSRMDSSRLLVVGAGQLAWHVALAHASVRELEVVEVWARRLEAAARVVGELVASGVPARASSDLRASVARADIVSTVTGATSPVVMGADLRPGTHLDLIGSFTPQMRESDDEAVARATIFVDSLAGALRSGDLDQPLQAGVIVEGSIKADLRDLVAGVHPGRTRDDEVTLFKSAGTALADLAAARLAWTRSRPD